MSGRDVKNPRVCVLDLRVLGEGACALHPKRLVKSHRRGSPITVPSKILEGVLKGFPVGFVF